MLASKRNDHFIFFRTLVSFFLVSSLVEWSQAATQRDEVGQGCNLLLSGLSASELSGESMDRVRTLIQAGVERGLIDRDGLVYLTTTSTIEDFPFRGSVESIGFEELLLREFSRDGIDWSEVNRIASELLDGFDREKEQRVEDEANSRDFIGFKVLGSRLLPDFMRRGLVTDIGGRPIAFYVSEESSSGFRFESIDVLSGEKANYSGRVSLSLVYTNLKVFSSSRLFSIRKGGKLYLVAAAVCRGERGEKDGFRFVVFPIDSPSLVEVYPGEKSFSLPIGETHVHIHSNEEVQEEILILMGLKNRVKTKSEILVLDPWDGNHPDSVYEREDADALVSLDNEKFIGVQLLEKEKSLVYWEDPKPSVRRSRRKNAVVDVPLPSRWEEARLRFDLKSIGVVGEGLSQRVVWMGHLARGGEKRSVIYSFDPFTKEVQMKLLPHFFTLLGKAGSASSAEDAHIGWIGVDWRQSSVRLLNFDLKENEVSEYVLKEFMDWRGSVGTSQDHSLETPLYLIASGKTYVVCPTRQSLRFDDADTFEGQIEFNVLSLSDGEIIETLHFPEMDWDDFRRSSPILARLSLNGRPLLAVRVRSRVRSPHRFVEYVLVRVMSN